MDERFAGALAATVAGRLNDRGFSRRTTGIALALLTASWLPLAFTRSSLWALAVGVILLDLAVQAVHVTNQTLIYALYPDAGSRLIHDLLLDRQRHRCHRRDLSLHGGRLGRCMHTGRRIQLRRAPVVGVHPAVGLVADRSPVPRLPGVLSLVHCSCGCPCGGAPGG